MDANSITVDREALKNMLSDFSTVINQVALNLARNFCQLGQHQQAHQRPSSVLNNVVAAETKADSSSGTRTQYKKAARRKVYKLTLYRIDDVEGEGKGDTEYKTNG